MIVNKQLKQNDLHDRDQLADSVSSWQEPASHATPLLSVVAGSTHFGHSGAELNSSLGKPASTMATKETSHFSQ